MLYNMSQCHNAIMTQLHHVNIPYSTTLYINAIPNPHSNQPPSTSNQNHTNFKPPPCSSCSSTHQSLSPSSKKMASVVWIAVFLLLSVELFLTCILVLPLPRFIRHFLAKKIFSYDLARRFKFISNFIILGLILSVADAITTLRHLTQKEEHIDPGHTGHADRAAYMGLNLDKQRKFRAERNMYLSSFALTLVFVIARLVELMQQTITLEEEKDALAARVKQLSQANGENAPVTDISAEPTSPLRRRAGAPKVHVHSNTDKTD